MSSERPLLQSPAVDWPAYEREGVAAFAAAASADELADVHVRYLGRKAPLPQALREVRDRETGKLLNDLRKALEAAAQEAESRLARAAAALQDPTFDPTLPGDKIPRGRLHPLTQIRREIEDVFLGLGYRIFDGREIDTVDYNFTALNTPEAHPSRDAQDTFYLDDETVLRTHTSPSQIRAMLEQQPPIYVVSLGRVYRRDTADATHTAVFHQVEALAVDRGITLGDLRGTVEHLSRALFGAEREVRMRTSFFPFTEPSVEFDVTCHLCNAKGCPACRHSGWIEMGGAGMVDPAVFEHVGNDAGEWSGFALGFGYDRIAMLRHGLPGIRLLWDNDIRFLSQF